MTFLKKTSSRQKLAALIPFTLLLAGCEVPVSEVVGSDTNETPYVPDPERPPVAEADEAPWDFPWDAGSNPYHEVTDAFDVVIRAKQVDVLFVMDNSGSMAQEQAGVVDSFSTFLEGFTNERIDYHIGVISTDTRTNAASWTGAAYTNFPNAGAGSLLAYRGNPRFISTELGRSEAIRQFRLNATLGLRGSGAESGMLSVVNALAPSKVGAGQWNEGFFRPEAMLSVVVVSDEDESHGDTSTRYIKRDVAEETARIEQFTGALRALKPNRPDLLRLDLVIAPSQAECPSVGSDGGVLGTGDTYKKAHASFYQGATQGLGSVMNVCTNFSGQLGNLGAQIAVQIERRFELQKHAEGELKVFLNGSALAISTTQGYTYTAATHSIELHGLDLENMGAYQVRAEYIGKKTP